MSKIKKIFLSLVMVALSTALLMVNVSADSRKWTSRYDTFNYNLSLRPSEYSSKTQKFTVQGKKNKTMYLQMHVGYDGSLSSINAAAIKGFSKNPEYYYSTIKEKTRFDITVKDSKGKIVAQRKNVKYGHIEVFKCSNQKYTITVKPYFSSYDAYRSLHRGAAHYAQWSTSYYYK